MTQKLLGDFADVISGVSYKPADITESGVRILRGGNIQNGELILKSDDVFLTEEYRDWKNSIQEGDTVVVASTGSTEALGKAATCWDESIDAQIGAFLRIVRPKKKEFAATVSAWLTQPHFSRYIVNVAKGACINNIKREHLLEYPIYVADDAEQERFSKFYESIDRLIQLSRKRIVELEKMAKEIYDYWFVQFDFPDKNGKPYKSSGGKMVYNPQLKRKIPEGWEVAPLGVMISNVNTGLNPRDNFKFGGSIKYLTVKNLSTSGTIDLSKCDYIDEEAYKLVHARSDISKGDILFASIEPLGRCYLIQDKPQGWDINESVFSIRPNYDKVCSEYLFHFFMSEWFIARASRLSVGSIFKGIRISEIMRLEVLLPSKTVVDGYGKLMSPILRSIKNASDEIAELTALREFLLPLLMNGQAKMGGAA